MNLGQLRGAIERNKKGLAIAGAAGVAGLALLNKSKKGAAPTTGPAGDALGTGSQYGLGMPATGGVYDSSSSDAYNAIQPQLESLGRMLEAATKTAPPIPVTTPPAYADGFYRNSTSGAIYQLNRGVLDWLNPKEWAAFGGGANPVVEVTRDNRFWGAVPYANEKEKGL